MNLVDTEIQYGQQMVQQNLELQMKMRTTSNAHIALAEYFAQNRPDINQIDAATLGLQELNNQTVTSILKYQHLILIQNINKGDAGTPATLALGGEQLMLVLQ